MTYINKKVESLKQEILDVELELDQLGSGEAVRRSALTDYLLSLGTQLFKIELSRKTK